MIAGQSLDGKLLGDAASHAGAFAHVSQFLLLVFIPLMVALPQSQIDTL